MQLIFLLLLLIAPYALLTVAEWWRRDFHTTTAFKARAGLSLFFAFTALGHFIKTDEMSAMLPPVVSHPFEIIYVTGVLELLGAIGLWIPRLRRLTGISLMLYLICVFPANIYAALMRVNFGGHALGPAYLLVRLPLQLFVIGWTYVATEQRWLSRRRTHVSADTASHI